MRGRADIFVALCLGVSQLARSRANSKASNLSPNPHILTRHRCTAELRVIGIEPRRSESLKEEPTPESNDLAMSHLRIRETNISPCVGLAPSLYSTRVLAIRIRLYKRFYKVGL